MSILESIIDNMQTGAKIVSEQHDAGRINWARGLSDPGEMIRCGYLPELRRIAGESDATYQARLESLNMPAEVMEKVKSAALSRASLASANGRISAAFALKAPWHGLGTVVDKAMTSAEALHLAGMDWRVEKMPLHFSVNGNSVAVRDSFSIARADTWAPLGTVGSRYAPIQNTEGFECLDSVLSEYGARYESAGALYGGKAVWILAQLPAQKFTVNGDEMKAYALFVNYHDGSGAGVLIPTNERVECANTMRVALKGQEGKGLRIRHTGNIKDKVRSAQTALGIACKGFDDFKTQAETLVSKPASINHYANDVLDACLEITQAQAKMGADVLASTLTYTQATRDLAVKSFARKIEQRETILADILERYDSGTCHPRGTAWAALNAVTEHADHGKQGKEAQDRDTRLSRRFESAMNGDRDEMKQVALAKALAM